MYWIINKIWTILDRGKYKMIDATGESPLGVRGPIRRIWRHTQYVLWPTRFFVRLFHRKEASLKLAKGCRI